MTSTKSILVEGIPMSYVEMGSGDPIVFLHGNPTSSYLWRNIMPAVANQGRCLAPDLIGMGRSGKMPDRQYSFLDHAAYLDEWFEALDLKNVTLVLHDWGSALGFYWAYRNPARVRAICYMEAIVRPREWEDFPNGREKIFKALRSPGGEAMVRDENFFVEMVLPKSIMRTLTPEEMENYRRPFLIPADRLLTLTFARELPIAGEPAAVVDIVDRYGRWLAQSPIPKLLIVAEPGALLTGKDLAFCRTWLNQQETTVPGIHYLQEDSPREIGEALATFLSEL